jgi:hypothetical protein
MFLSRVARRDMVEDNPHHFPARAGIDLLHDAVQMIADGKFREIQLRSNLFVRQTFCHKTHQLLLPQGQFETWSCPAFLLSVRSLHKSLKQRGTQSRRADSFPPGDCSNSGDYIVGGSVSKKVTERSCVDRFEKLLRIVFHAEQDRFDFNAFAMAAANKRRQESRIQKVESDNVAPGVEQPGNWIASASRLAHNLKIQAFAAKPVQ